MPNKKKIDLTPDGYLQVEQELNKLREQDRPRIIQAIKDARAQGDLSENADYDAARDEQAKVEGRIKELEYMIANANIIEAPKGKVGLGSIVTVKYVDDNDEDEYKIVGSTEVDVANNKISNESPIGKALFGKKAGETVDVESPNGSYKIEIIKIA